MYRLFAFAAVLAMALSFVAMAEDKKEEKDKKKEEKTPSIEKIMKDAHGEDGLRAKLKEAVKGKKWDDAKKAAEEWVKLSAALGKNEPPKGTKESWKKQSESYEKQIKTLADAVKGEKGEDATKADKALGANCGACHKAHKP